MPGYHFVAYFDAEPSIAQSNLLFPVYSEPATIITSEKRTYILFKATYEDQDSKRLLAHQTDLDFSVEIAHTPGIC